MKSNVIKPSSIHLLSHLHDIHESFDSFTRYYAGELPGCLIGPVSGVMQAIMRFRTKFRDEVINPKQHRYDENPGLSAIFLTPYFLFQRNIDRSRYRPRS